MASGEDPTVAFEAGQKLLRDAFAKVVRRWGHVGVVRCGCEVWGLSPKGAGITHTNVPTRQNNCVQTIARETELAKMRNEITSRDMKIAGANHGSCFFRFWRLTKKLHPRSAEKGATADGGYAKGLEREPAAAPGG